MPSSVLSSELLPLTRASAADPDGTHSAFWLSACGRFNVDRYDSAVWRLGANTDASLAWLTANELDVLSFRSRRAAIETLTACLSVTDTPPRRPALLLPLRPPPRLPYRIGGTGVLLNRHHDGFWTIQYRDPDGQLVTTWHATYQAARVFMATRFTGDGS